MIKYNWIVQTVSCLFAVIMKQSTTLDNSCKPSKSGDKIMQKLCGSAQAIWNRFLCFEALNSIRLI